LRTGRQPDGLNKQKDAMLPASQSCSSSNCV